MALVVSGFGLLEGVKNHELEQATVVVVVVVVALTVASMLTLVLIWHRC